MPFITSLDGHGTSKRKLTYSDAAKGLLRTPSRNDQPSVARNDPPSEEPPATSTEQYGYTDVPRTPNKMENINFPPQGCVEHLRGSPSEYDPYPAARYHFESTHHSLYSPAPTIPIGRAFPHDRSLGATPGPHITSNVQRTPNPLQMTIDQPRQIPGYQVSQNYGQCSQGMAQDGYGKVTSGAQRQNAGMPAMSQDSEPDLVKPGKPGEDKYDVLMNQYTKRWYDCDVDPARYLPNVEPSKESNIRGLES
ncbi:MAG: hypothetical protein L6R38_000703 [Xanthoria sp. 2 TBL-2021]|nr:MAG: hypothetical protein L6R38_000703 [Xanthoria sp. 2 TBL-2021]